MWTVWGWGVRAVVLLLVLFVLNICYGDETQVLMLITLPSKLNKLNSILLFLYSGIPFPLTSEPP